MAEHISNNMFDIIVIGGGPAGMTAALYAARQGRSVLLIEKSALGGQALSSGNIENIPGIPSISGAEWALNFEGQLRKHNVQIVFDEVQQVRALRYMFIVECNEKQEYGASALILANGVKHRLPDIPGIEPLVGHGVSVCATCDGDFYHNKTIAVIGGGNTAAEDALLLSKNGNKVYMLQNLPMLTCEEHLKAQLDQDLNITFGFNINLTKIQKVNDKIFLENENNMWILDGVFVAIGMAPDNWRFRNIAIIDQYGYYGKPFHRGVFYAGDCRYKAYRQITTACADGTIAALEACKFLNTENL